MNILLDSHKKALGREWSRPFCRGQPVRSLRGLKPVVLSVTLEVAGSGVSAGDGSESASMNCEVSGYATFTGSLTWSDSNGERILANSKYGLSLSIGSSTLIYPNGTIGPSIMSTLTIRSVTFQNEGSYVCSINDLMNSVQLTVTPPPTFPTPTTTASTAASTIRATTVPMHTTTESIPAQGSFLILYISNAWWQA